jgi:DNA-binding CsgD family transcriptional regulator/tetratricopeptide (TPR) repeat protein
MRAYRFPVALIERDDELASLIARAHDAGAGHGGVVMVTGEAGAGKTTFVEEFVRRLNGGSRVLWGACDPLDTPRPLGPLFDVANAFSPETRTILHGAEHAYQIFDAVTADLASTPTVLVVDDLHWADQGTSDFLRHILRRIGRSTTLVVVTARNDEAPRHDDPVRLLLGDVARSSSATSIAVQPLSVDGVTQMVGDRGLDPELLHRLSGGNAFFVTQLLDYDGDELPATVRDAILARTVGLDADSWDALNLLSCSSGAVPGPVMAALGTTGATLRRLSAAHLVRATARGVTFWHDLCRLAVADVIPAGAEPQLHSRLVAAYDDIGSLDHATIAHHALGAGDRVRLKEAATAAGRVAARSGAHRQSADFFRTALSAQGGGAVDDAALLEQLAAELYLIDRLDEAIDACGQALELRRAARDVAGTSADHNALAIYEWYNANRSGADRHVIRSIDVHDETGLEAASLGHGYAMRAFLAMQSASVDEARVHLARARRVSGIVDDPGLRARIAIIDGLCDVVAGESAGRARVLDVLAHAPQHLDEIHSSGYSNLAYFDVEHRRLDTASDLLATSIDLTIESDLPVCHVWQLASRGRLEFLSGRWHEAMRDSAAVLDGPSAPLARPWPLLIRGLVALRSRGDAGNDLEQAWELSVRYGEPWRVLPAAAALVEQMWLTGVADGRITDLTRLVGEPGDGLHWARGDLAVWLARAGVEVPAGDLAPPCRSYISGEIHRSAEMLIEGGLAFDAAIAFTETGDLTCVSKGLLMLDRLEAHATADKIRRDLRQSGMTAVPSRRRATTVSNAAGLTNRQTEVLALLGEGLTNAEMAARLYLSEKTVDHHVSAILTRLDVANRREAARRGRELGIVD